jgi:hypothetical protein
MDQVHRYRARHLRTKLSTECVRNLAAARTAGAGLGLPYFCAWGKSVYKSTTLCRIKVLAHNLIHKKCAERVGQWISSGLARFHGPFSAARFWLLFFCAAKKTPLKSKGLMHIKALAHNLIHKRCAELANRAPSGAQVGPYAR